ncbi:MAG: hypothetical protein KYX69_07465 [Sphingomonas sp.]|uniref:hypothetical protein n=1 Tax=Sphingomonas sp. TaxID=28214 RepID=UPI00260C3F55|nr:hypothetical protein [Sphingomonas sp.]MDK2767541.1 hypothetical protein [Sphingomonas sp.]
MKVLAVIPSILLFGCDAEPADPNALLMDKIETSVVMPGEARSLDQYARYYLQERDGSVRAVFTYHFPDTPSDAECEEMGKGTVPCEESAAFRSALKAGERIWLKNSDELPSIADGGCSVIEFSIPANVVKDRHRRWRIEARCNGR